MSARLENFDYKMPYFYMVTMKAGKESSLKVPFSRVLDSGEIATTTVTLLFENVIEHFHETWWCIEPIRYYVIMPDHLHLIIKMRDVDGRVSVAVVVRQLMKALATAVSKDETSNTIFEFEWHDWIVKKEGQLDAFRRYIADNPRRLALRRANKLFFTKAREIVFNGARYWAYGNEALLKLPVIVAIKGHRSPPPYGVLQGGLRAAHCGPTDRPEQNQPSSRLERNHRSHSSGQYLDENGLLSAASRIGPGGAGLSTFLSPLEKNAGNAIIKAGGALIVLSMTGFGERWHPTEKQEGLCAEGRMLYLSPYAPQAARLDKKEMFIRAHALVDWALTHSHYRLEAWP